MRIFVAGGTGIVGRPLVGALVNAGHDVTATAHRTESLSVVEALGARPVLMEGLDDESVRDAVLEAGPEVIVNQITSLSTPASDYGTWLAMTNKLRVRTTTTLMNTAVEAGTSKVVAQSASFMTEPGGTDLTDETSPLYLDAPEPLRSHSHANLAAELQVTGTAGIEGIVLRYGFLYGAGTSIGPGGDIGVAVQAGEMPIVGEGAGYYPMIHVRDAVSATLQAIDQAVPGIYNIVDDEPARQGVWLPFLAEMLKAPAPPQISEEDAASRLGIQAVYYGNQLRPASNAKAKSELAWKLEFPSWREGFRDAFA